MYTHACMHAHTHRVLQVVLSGGAGECVPVYGPRPDKLAHRGAMLATLAKMWEHYGFRSKCVLSIIPL